MTEAPPRNDEDPVSGSSLQLVLQIAVLRSLPELGAKLLRETLPNFFAAGKSLRDKAVGVESSFTGPDGQTYAVMLLVSRRNAEECAAAEAACGRN